MDVRLSSWTKEKAYDVDLGPSLGMADAIRNPGFIERAREAYLLPKERNEDIVVGICLREDDMVQLRGDTFGLSF